MRINTLGTLMMSALFLAGCGGGAGSFAPHAPISTVPNQSAFHRSFHDGLAAGDFRAVCSTVTKRGRAHCVAYMLTASGRSEAAALMRASGRGTASEAIGTHASAPAPQGYGPSDLQSAYNLTGAVRQGGNGALVAIVDAYDDPLIESDLNVYRKMYGLSPCTTANGCFKKVNQNGRNGPLPTLPPADIPGESGWTIETALDVDMVSANCPNCRILLVETNDDYMNNLAAGVNAAASFNPDSISNSYVSQESPTDPGPASQGGLLSFYTHPGIAVVAGAGDYGYDWNIQPADAYGDPAIAYGPLIPAAFPTVVTAGGTTLTPDPRSRRGWDEVAWDGTGSGCSEYEAMPPWQRADPNCATTYTTQWGNSFSVPSRIYGDVAYDADGYTGVAIYESDGQLGGNNWGVIGGTSIASPAIAAIYGLAGYGGPGNADQYVYPYPAQKLYRSNALYDITSGSNGDCQPVPAADMPSASLPMPPPPCNDMYLFTAIPGYDGPTGNGTPNGIAAF